MQIFRDDGAHSFTRYFLPRTMFDWHVLQAPSVNANISLYARECPQMPDKQMSYPTSRVVSSIVWWIHRECSNGKRFTRNSSFLWTPNTSLQALIDY